MKVLLVPRENAQVARLALSALSLVDVHKRIVEEGQNVVIPLRGEPPGELIGRYCGALEERYLPSRNASSSPFDRIRDMVAENLQDRQQQEGGLNTEAKDSILSILPERWEKLGDVVCLRMPEECRVVEQQVASAYAEVLDVRAVVDYGSIRGIYREPTARIIFGPVGEKSLETTHRENGISYRMDVLGTMFSSGNIDERVRMSQVPCSGENIVDMFAGIGYFTVPLAVYGAPKSIMAYELNPRAHRYLEENCRLNNVQDKVCAMNMDNRMCPVGIADRIIMGYVGTTHHYLQKAMAILKKEGGWIHYHETCPNELIPERPMKRVEEAASLHGFSVEASFHKVKSYAPGVTHIVLDARLSV